MADVVDPGRWAAEVERFVRDVTAAVPAAPADVAAVLAAMAAEAGQMLPPGGGAGGRRIAA